MIVADELSVVVAVVALAVCAVATDNEAVNILTPISRALKNMINRFSYDLILPKDVGCL